MYDVTIRLLYSEFLLEEYFYFDNLYYALVTPERLCNKDFLELLDVVHENHNLNRLVVDEASDLAITISAELTSFARHIVSQ